MFKSLYNIFSIISYHDISKFIFLRKYENNICNIFIKDVKDRHKMIDYLNNNGIIWCSNHEIKHTDKYFLKGITKLNLLINDNGVLYWNSSKIWKEYASKYTIFTENEFYDFFESLKNDVINKITLIYDDINNNLSRKHI